MLREARTIRPMSPILFDAIVFDLGGVSPSSRHRDLGTALPLRGRPKWLALGRYPDIDLADARKRAAEARVNVWEGWTHSRAPPLQARPGQRQDLRQIGRAFHPAR